MATRDFSVTLSNDYNSFSYAYQGGFGEVSVGSRVTTREGYLSISGLNVLAGKTITEITLTNCYEGGKNRVKTIEFTEPYYSFTTSTYAYGGNVGVENFTSGALFEDVVAAANGSGYINWTINNGETTTTTVDNDGTGSYTDNYVYISSCVLTVTYVDSYTISYNANGGTAGSLPSSTSVSAGSSYTLPSCNMRKTYNSGSYTVTFNWNTSSSDTSNWTTRTADYENYYAFDNKYWSSSTGQVSVGSSITVNRNLEFYAQYKSSLTSSVGSISEPSDPSRPGYTF